jgi:hypothetical protein
LVAGKGAVEQLVLKEGWKKGDHRSGSFHFIALVAVDRSVTEAVERLRATLVPAFDEIERELALLNELRDKITPNRRKRF